MFSLKEREGAGWGGGEERRETERETKTHTVTDIHIQRRGGGRLVERSVEGWITEQKGQG